MKSTLSNSQRARLGAKRRYELYGNPGTPEGRSKGGHLSSEFFKSHPARARQRGFIIRKQIKSPFRCLDVANFIGIMLGDGSIRSKYQLAVSFNYKTDREFAQYTAGLVKRLFGIEHIMCRRKGSLGADMIVSSAGVVGFLLQHGLKTGNKIKHQIDMPEWIKSNAEFRKACLRGLVDTDGSLYRHRYKVHNKWYEYLKIDFTSRSAPLLHSVFETLADLGIKASLEGVHITVSAKADVNRYLSIVGSSNTKFLDRWRSFGEVA